jgi:hypothetical protein
MAALTPLESEVESLHNEATRIIKANPLDIAKARDVHNQLVACEQKIIEAGYIDGARILQTDADDLANLIGRK